MAVDLEADVLAVGTEIAEAFPSALRHPRRALDARAMEVAAHDEQLRAALFRFVDVMPGCRSLDDLAGHLTALLGEVDEQAPPLRAALRMGDTAAGRKALGAAAAAGVRHMAHRFIAAETPRGVHRLIGELWRQGIGTSIDLLGEATVTEPEADRYAQRCVEALEELAAIHARLPAHAGLEADSSGPIARANLSVKVSALTPLLRPAAPERGMRDAATRLRALLRLARDRGAHLHVDMESLDTREAVADVLLELLAEDEFRAGPSAGVVVQAYLRDSPQLVERLLEWARVTPREQPLVVRLVKGAYWDHEVVEARQHGWPVPVFADKAECDRAFEALTVRLLEARPVVRVAVASHNLRSVAHAVTMSRRLGADDRDLELQVLRGLGDDLAQALASLGLRVRAYCPVGDLVSGMAYLVRRLLENTANESFLAEHARGTPLEELLAAP